MIRTTAALLISALVCGCGGKPPRTLTYLALEKPAGRIDAASHATVDQSFSRGGFYVLNYNFRPAADVKQYLEEAQRVANTKVLRGANVALGVPFALDIFFFGYNSGTDKVVASGN